MDHRHFDLNPMCENVVLVELIGHYSVATSSEPIQLITRVQVGALEVDRRHFEFQIQIVDLTRTNFV